MILEGADVTFNTAEYPELSSALVEMDLPVTMELIEIMEYLDVGEIDRLNVDTQNKIKAIYEYALKQGRPLDVITALNCQIGHTQQAVVDRLYQYIRLNSEIETTAENLGGLLKQKQAYENSHNT
jgi:hypothetical protein